MPFTQLKLCNSLIDQDVDAVVGCHNDVLGPLVTRGRVRSVVTPTASGAEHCRCVYGRTGSHVPSQVYWRSSETWRW